MKNTWSSNNLICLYFSMLMVLLLLVSTTPLLIQNGITLSNHLIIEEDVLETALILALFGISFLLLIRIMRRLEAYREAIDSAVIEKSKLVARLADAFRYIGKVNVEIQEIESALCGVAFYPQSKKEFRAIIHQLALKALAISTAPWLIVRMIDRQSGRTVSEHGVHHPGETIPAVTLGNRAILDDVRIDAYQIVGPRQNNLDLLTVMIFAGTAISKEQTILLAAILNQIEMLFILYRSGCIKPVQTTKKERVDDFHY
jgi:hypothetical protein